MKLRHVPVSDIVIDKRHRQELDVDAMARSIEQHGILQPVGLTSDLQLRFGERRVRAFEKLGYKEIPAIIDDTENITEQEMVENFDRKDFTILEQVEIGRTIEEEAAAKAKANMSAAGRDKQVPENINTRKELDRRLPGIASRTYEKAKAVVEAAEKDPDKYGHLIEEMQRTNKVNSAHKKLTVKQDEERVMSLEPVNGKYRTIVMDPPWDMDWLSESGRAMGGYAKMSLEEIKAIDPGKWADDEFCHLYLWVPNSMLPIGMMLLEHWGFQYRSILHWKKNRISTGHYTRNNTEQVLLATRGSKVTRVNDQENIFEGNTDVFEHSDKPTEFYDIVCRMSYAPYGEAFQRMKRPNFENLYQQKEESNEKHRITETA